MDAKTLAERLRGISGAWLTPQLLHELAQDAADMIERQAAELAALRAEVARHKQAASELFDECQRRGRRALTKTEFARIFREHTGAVRFTDDDWRTKELVERAHGIDAARTGGSK